MGFMTRRKRMASVLAAVIIAAALTGCGGKKEAPAKAFAVPPDQMPEGVISLVTPMPNNETLFVRAMVQEAVRRGTVAQLYNEALIHYDIKKGNAADHQKLLKRAQKAWEDARAVAAAATFYAIGLSELERSGDWDPYRQTAMGILPEIRLMRAAYAAEKRLNTKAEVYSKINKVGIRKEISRFPESKQLLAITKMYHTSGQTACEIMNEVNPDYQATGRSWQDKAADVAYRGCHVAKTAGKVAGVGLAAVGLTAVATPVAAVGGMLAFGVKLVDTAVDATQTTTVLFTGEENEGINKVLAVTGTADTVCSLVTFDFSKPLMGNHGVNVKSAGPWYKNIPNTFKAYFKGGANNTVRFGKNLAKTGKSAEAALTNYNSGFSAQNLKIAAKQLFVSEGNLNLLGVTTGVAGFKENVDTVVGKAGQTKDGTLDYRNLSINSKQIEEELKKAKALEVDPEEIKKALEEIEQAQAKAATAASEELEKAAEKVEATGPSGEAKELMDDIVDSTNKGLIEAFTGPGGTMGDLGRILNDAAAVELKATGQLGKAGETGDTAGTGVPQKTATEKGTPQQAAAEKTDTQPPFAPSKVAGTYKIRKNGTTLTFVVRKQGNGILCQYHYYRNNKPKTRNETPASYDPQTGRGLFAVEGSTCPFWFTKTGGKMNMHIGDWKKTKK